uniref:Uncharacterized protein n=1 Tax=Arundo donax TaxID=35708 RepID=A0A0A9A079_ARUDO
MSLKFVNHSCHGPIICNNNRSKCFN